MASWVLSKSLEILTSYKQTVPWLHGYGKKASYIHNEGFASLP